MTPDYQAQHVTQLALVAPRRAEGEFLPLPALDTSAGMEVFRRLLLQRLHQAERLSESYMRNLLSWVHVGAPSYVDMRPYSRVI